MSKKIKKIIPKEIKPALPFIAAYFGAPILGKAMFGPGVLTAGQSAIAKGLTSALVSKAQGDDTKAALRSGIFAAAPDVVSGGLSKVGTALTPQTTTALKESLKLSSAGSSAVPVSQQIGSILSGAGQSLASTGYTPGEAISFKDAAKVIGSQAAIESGTRLAELNEKALRDYEAQLKSQGIMDSAERRNQIFGYFSRAGYADDEINSMLNKYGYAYGGRVGFANGTLDPAKENQVKQMLKMGADVDTITSITGVSAEQIQQIQQTREPKSLGGRVGYEKGGLADLIEYLKEKEDKDEFRVSDLTSAMSGFETAFGRPFMEKPQPMGITPGFGNLPRMANGGLMSLREGGMPVEMDMRGGGFVPIGKQRRADDVPARLSKDEFVLTARAVDGVGKATTGNAKDGAKIMYDFMNKYEALA